MDFIMDITFLDVCKVGFGFLCILIGNGLKNN